jgi:hypothetical protein
MFAALDLFLPCEFLFGILPSPGNITWAQTKIKAGGGGIYRLFGKLTIKNFIPHPTIFQLLHSYITLPQKH